jgi:hypothetical protein
VSEEVVVEEKEAVEAAADAAVEIAECEAEAAVEIAKIEAEAAEAVAEELSDEDAELLEEFGEWQQKTNSSLEMIMAELTSIRQSLM